MFSFVFLSYELTFLTNIYHNMLYFAHISVIYVPIFHFYGDFCDFAVISVISLVIPVISVISVNRHTTYTL